VLSDIVIFVQFSTTEILRILDCRTACLLPNRG